MSANAPTIAYEALHHLPVETLRHYDNETIFCLVEDGKSIAAETVAAGRALHGKWVTGDDAVMFRARRAARQLIAGAVMVCAASGALAMDAEETAQAAAVADGASTALAVASGAVESNPVVNAAGLLPITVLKVALPRLVRDAAPETRKAALVGGAALWGGAAINNLLISAGAASVALPVGIVAGIWLGMRQANKVDAEQTAVVAMKE